MQPGCIAVQDEEHYELLPVEVLLVLRREEEVKLLYDDKQVWLDLILAELLKDALDLANRDLLALGFVWVSSCHVALALSALVIAVRQVLH